MTTAGFLDTGVYIGYCFTVDSHHDPCRRYVTEQADIVFTSETVLDEYRSAKRSVSERYSDAVRKHISDVRRSDLDGELGPMDLDRAKRRILDRRNELYEVLVEVSDSLPQFIQYDDLLDRLQNLARDIDTMAVQRKQDLDDTVDVWDQKTDHPDVRAGLDIHEPDLTICIEGHDLAAHLADDTELATANPTDFVYDGQRERILDLTAYSDVIDLSG
ncbi:MAG: hypothetical protein ABEJ86_06865 [Halococcoides sp.]